MPEESYQPRAPASIQPMGDFTNTGSNDLKAGTPGYTDASGGPSTTKVPNANPHHMQPKGGKNYAKNKKKKEFLKLLEKDNILNGGVWQPGDPEIDYVETDTPKQCKTCEYMGRIGDDGRAACNLPPHGLSITVDPDRGCCNSWEEDTDDTMEAFEEALTEAKPMKLQSIIFDKDNFTADTAKTWLDKYKKDKDLDTSGPSIRARQADPSKFDGKSFRTITLKKGIKAVVGKLKPEMADQKVCQNCGLKVDADAKTCPYCNGIKFNPVPVEAKQKYCKGCSSSYEDSPKIVTCKKCGSMEFTATPMNKFTLAGP